MAQFTLRINDDLAAAIRSEAAQTGRSVNAWLTFVARVATDQQAEGDEVTRLREKLRRAGLLSEHASDDGPDVDDEVFREARAAAGRGTPLSQLVSEGRGPR